MNLEELKFDYASKISKYLGACIEDFLKLDITSKNFKRDALYALVEKPVYLILRDYAKERNRDLYKELEGLLDTNTVGVYNKSKEFFRIRSWPLDAIEKKIVPLKGADIESFYVNFYKIPEIVDLFNDVFDTVSFLVLGKAYKGDFEFKF